ncbi:MAG: hypothetical protein ACRCYP_04930, partial [Alphaproteobacteria bacterium]
MFFNKKLFLLKLLSVAAVVSEGMALSNLDQDPEDLYSSSLCLSDLRKKLDESNDLLEKSIILANNIMSVRDNPSLHDDLMPAAVEDIKSLFTAQNPGVELESFSSARDNILDYAIQQMTPSEGQAICYRSLATHIVLGESSDPKIMELLPMCLHFVELDNSKRELIMRLEKAQRGGIRLTFCNNLFVYLAKRLEGQKNGDAQNNSAYLGSFEDEPEVPPISNFIAPPVEYDDDYEVHVYSESEESDDEDFAIARSQEDAIVSYDILEEGASGSNAAASALSLQEGDIIALIEGLKITKGEATKILEKDPNAIETLRLTQNSGQWEPSSENIRVAG